MRRALVVITGLLIGWTLPAPAEAAVTMETDTVSDIVSEPLDGYTVVGAFVDYAPEAQEITLQDDNGEEMIFLLDPDVRITVNGQPGGLDQLQAGDRLTLTVVDDDLGDEYALAIAAQPVPSEPASSP